MPSSIGGVVLEIKVKEGRRSNWRGHLTIEGRRGRSGGTNRASTNRSTHVGAARGAARVSVGDAGRGQTEEQAAAADRPQAASVAFSMPVQLARLRARTAILFRRRPHVRRMAREIGVNIRSWLEGPGGEISEDE